MNRRFYAHRPQQRFAFRPLPQEHWSFRFWTLRSRGLIGCGLSHFEQSGRSYWSSRVASRSPQRRHLGTTGTRCRALSNAQPQLDEDESMRHSLNGSFTNPTWSLTEYSTDILWP